MTTTIVVGVVTFGVGWLIGRRRKVPERDFQLQVAESYEKQALTYIKLGRFREANYCLQEAEKARLAHKARRPPVTLALVRPGR